MEFKAFLSHRYKSPIVNQYFFDVFSRNSQVQFEVDAGSAPTCVTRIERMIRDCDAFIGIYPLPDRSDGPIDQTWMLAASKYFRLECNIAIRSRIPTLIFHDRQYRDLFLLPDHVHSEQVDMNEVTSSGGIPNRRRHEHVFDAFQSEVKAYLEFHAVSNQRHSRKAIGILVPQGRKSQRNYNQQEVELIRECLSNNGYTHIEMLTWPPVFDGTLLSVLDNLDFMVVDIGSDVMATGIVGFLQGRCIPCIRLLKDSSMRGGVFTRRIPQRNIFGAVPVGYTKDIVRWTSIEQLQHELSLRLSFIDAKTRRINTFEEANQYFSEAVLRKDPVFLSYSGADAAIARLISAELKRRFQTVFDYQDGQSITPGEPWLKEIFDKLSGAKFALPLVSPNYLASDNCMHEAQEIVALQDAKELRMIPVKLSEDKIDPPSWMRNRQYMQYYRYRNVAEVVDKLVEFFDRYD